MQVTSAVVIGYGSTGRRLARLLRDRYEQLAIVDFDDGTRDAANAEYPDVPVVRDLCQMDTLHWPWDKTMGVIATWGPSHAAVFSHLVSRGVKHILCEKPLANSYAAGAHMIQTAEEAGIVLGVHNQWRYSGFIARLRLLSDKLGLGAPCSMFVQGGALGLVTTGIHFIDWACELFDQGPESVVSSAVGSPINPRSLELMFYGGTAAWSFGPGREASFCFSNGSSVASSVSVYYRDAEVRVSKLSLYDKGPHVAVGRRLRGDVERFPEVTRIGEPADTVFCGPLPGLLARSGGTIKLLEEIESGTVRGFPPALALQALGACIGALAAGDTHQAVSLPIDPASDLAQVEWPIT